MNEATIQVVKPATGIQQNTRIRVNGQRVSSEKDTAESFGDMVTAAMSFEGSIKIKSTAGAFRQGDLESENDEEMMSITETQIAALIPQTVNPFNILGSASEEGVELTLTEPSAGIEEPAPEQTEKKLTGTETTKQGTESGKIELPEFIKTLTSKEKSFDGSQQLISSLLEKTGIDGTHKVRDLSPEQVLNAMADSDLNSQEMMLMLTLYQAARENTVQGDADISEFVENEAAEALGQQLEFLSKVVSMLYQAGLSRAEIETALQKTFSLNRQEAKETIGETEKLLFGEKGEKVESAENKGLNETPVIKTDERLSEETLKLFKEAMLSQKGTAEKSELPAHHDLLKAHKVDAADKGEAVQFAKTGQGQELTAKEATDVIDIKDTQLPLKLANKTLLNLESGIKQCSIQLTPKELGKINIEIVMLMGKAVVNIICENQRAQMLLSAYSRDIKQILENNTGLEATVNTQHEENLYGKPDDYDGRNGNENPKKNSGNKPGKDETQNFINQLKFSMLDVS